MILLGPLVRQMFLTTKWEPHLDWKKKKNKKKKNQKKKYMKQKHQIVWWFPFWAVLRSHPSVWRCCFPVVLSLWWLVLMSLRGWCCFPPPSFFWVVVLFFPLGDASRSSFWCCRLPPTSFYVELLSSYLLRGVAAVLPYFE